MNDQGASGKMALKGLRVIDFGVGVIVPLATSYMADFGAEVIKVESTRQLDFMRGTDYHVDEERDINKNTNFARMNQNKLGVSINLKLPKGVALAKRLVATADVVMENMNVNAIHKLGLDYEALRQVKPDIIMLSAAFGGQTGPYRDFKGQGYIIAALEGLDELTGWPDRRMVSPGAPFCDMYVPWMWVSTIIAALEYRRRTGKGQFIDGSTFEGGLDILDTAIADYAVNGRVLKRRGNRHPAAAPHGVYRCRGEERWCAITVFNDKEWQGFCNVMGNPAWAAGAKFATMVARQANNDELEQHVNEWTQTRSAEEIVLKLQGAGVAAEVVKNIKDIYEDPQLAHRGHFWGEPGLEKFTFDAPSAKLSLTPARFQRRHPFLGEHNDYVFFDLLGMPPEEFAQLVEEGVIA